MLEIKRLTDKLVVSFKGLSDVHVNKYELGSNGVEKIMKYVVTPNGSVKKENLKNKFNIIEVSVFDDKTFNLVYSDEMGQYDLSSVDINKEDDSSSNILDILVSIPSQFYDDRMVATLISFATQYACSINTPEYKNECNELLEAAGEMIKFKKSIYEKIEKNEKAIKCNLNRLVEDTLFKGVTAVTNSVARKHIGFDLRAKSDREINNSENEK